MFYKKYDKLQQQLTTIAKILYAGILKKYVQDVILINKGFDII